MLKETVSPQQAEEKLHSLKNMRIVVTGGTTGIGRATARLLAKLGARILIYGRHEDDLNDALRELRDTSDQVFGLTADQSNPEEVDRVFEQADVKLGGLDALVNNAAVSAGSVTDRATEEWMYQIQTDLVGYMKCCEQAIPRLKESGGGWIVNIGSMSAKLREPGSDVYIAAKMGIRGFSDSLGKHLAEHKIHVTLIEPGLVLSELSPSEPEEQIEKQDKLEMILGEDIGRAVLYVLSQPIRCSIPFMQVRPLMQRI